MNKKLVIGAVAGVAVITAISVAKNKAAEPTPKPSVWEKMRAGLEDMPEDFPLRVMLDSIEAIRLNTERMVELAEQRWSDDVVANEGELIRTS